MPKRSPIHELHVDLGARFVTFGEWELPIQYTSVLAEHHAVRTDCGWFDVSHLGRFLWEGPDATAALRYLLSNDITRIEPGRAQYSMMLNERGGVIDDLIVWRWEENLYWVLPNASNSSRVMAEFARLSPSTHLEDLQPGTVAFAVQGPRAPELLDELLSAHLRRFRTFRGELDQRPFWGAGTGYTGESGGELVMATESATKLVSDLVGAGSVPCGLGARDTLRLEAGLPLWGNDLDEDTTPLEAGLDFAVSFDHDFRGRDCLMAQREGDLPKKLVAFRLEGRQIPRHGYPLRSGESKGVVSSGNYSPTLGYGIGIGYLELPTDGPLECRIRDRWIPAIRVDLPFFSR